MFKGCQLPTPVVLICILWYLRCKLSYRDLEEMMAERGVRWHRVNRLQVSFITATTAANTALENTSS